jgi:hypothetical protein
MTAASALALVVVMLPGVVLAYDVGTHRELGRLAVMEAIGLHQVLTDDLGFAVGPDTILQPGVSNMTVADWIREGAWREDQPVWRSRHHFHDPRRAWPSAGLSLDIASGIALGQSSIVWSQRAVQADAVGGGTWSWPFARQRFLAALTGPTAREREIAFAHTFRALGHLTHLIQDATVPAHVRNDIHLSVPLGIGRSFPLNPDWYEDWVEEVRADRPRDFVGLVAAPPRRPLRLVFRSEHAEAPIPIAGLIDTDQYAPDGPVPSLFGPPAFGLAELTSPNFVSRDTLFTSFPRPALSDLGPPFFEEENDAFQRYYPKVAGGTTLTEIEHFVAEAALVHHLGGAAELAPPSTRWTLDHRVLDDYARELLPRAIGYSAALLDYFFRGRLDLDVVSDPTDAALLTVTGVNASSEPLGGGTLQLYADTPGGARVAVPPLDSPTVHGVAPGEPLAALRFRAPADSERFVAVYQGALGLERPAEAFVGGVIGRIVGGERVEEVFADGAWWRLRTPVGVFDLPLATAVYAEVKWGDADDVLVARTPLTLDPPGFVATYEIARRAGSIEPKTSGAPPVVELQPLGFASLAFAAGAPPITTITLDQTIDHRQQIGRWSQELVVQWKTPDNFYQTVSLTRSPVTFETVHQQTIGFAATIPVRLDMAHNRRVGVVREPYVWDLKDVAADRAGRILGLVAISLTHPGPAPVNVPWYRLDSAGAPFVADTLRLDASFPDDATTIWALVALDDGGVVASTAEPTVAFVSRRASEGPPWDRAGATALRFPGIYSRNVTRFKGGDQDGQVIEEWVAGTLDPRRAADGIGAQLEAIVGEHALSVTGWFQPELAAALERAGAATFQAAEIEGPTQLWNYVCLTTPCTSDADFAGLAVVTHAGGVVRAPAQLVQARRARPAPGGERLVLLGDVERSGARPTGSVIAWDVDARRAREASRVPPSFHRLGPQASTSAVLVPYFPAVGSTGTLLVGLETDGGESLFVDQDLTVDFALVGPGQLYSLRDLRFYRREPPLRPTPLPARLSAVPGNPVGDYHAIRLP